MNLVKFVKCTSFTLNHTHNEYEFSTKPHIYWVYPRVVYPQGCITIGIIRTTELYVVFVNVMNIVLLFLRCIQYMYLKTMHQLVMNKDVALECLWVS